MEWTEKDIDFLIDNYNKLGLIGCSKSLNKTAKSIEYKARKLNLIKKQDIWSNDDIDFLIKNYDNLSNDEISLIINKSNNGVWNKARTLKLIKKQDVWSKEDIDFLIKNYENNGIDYICRKLKKSKDSVQYHTKIYNLKINNELRKERFLSRLNNKSPDTFRVNPDQFFNIIEKEIAYILGMLWADGYSYNNEISLTLIKDDGEKLLKIFNKTGDWKILYKQKENRKPQITFSTHNRIIYEYLKENDFKIKSYSTFQKIIDKVPDNLKKYFYRGYFDGDGTIFMKNGQYILNITSSFEQDWTTMENLMKKLDIKYFISKIETFNKLNKINRCSRIVIGNRKGLINFCNYIYDGFEMDNIGLERKYNIFINIKKTLNNG